MRDNKPLDDSELREKVTELSGEFFWKAHNGEGNILTDFVIQILSLIQQGYVKRPVLEPLSEEEKEKLITEYPLLDFSFEDDYREEVEILLNAQLQKDRKAVGG